MLRTTLAVLLVVAASVPAFDEASITSNISGQNGMFFTYRGGRFNATNVTLRMLIRSSYSVQDAQIVGGPPWMNSDRFNIVAKGDVGQSPALPVIVAGGPSRLQLMMQALLADRFKLVVHTADQESTVYALVVARSDGRLGPHLRRSEVDCAALAPAARPVGSCGLARGLGSISMGGRPIAQIANSLSNLVGMRVVDRTGLTGNFDIDLTWIPDLPIFTAVREQLGLELALEKSLAEVLVIDRAERPVEN